MASINNLPPVDQLRVRVGLAMAAAGRMPRIDVHETWAKIEPVPQDKYAVKSEHWPDLNPYKAWKIRYLADLSHFFEDAGLSALIVIDKGLPFEPFLAVGTVEDLAAAWKQQGWRMAR